jgi:nucleotide-binding universal stress UspA family protein
MAAHGRGAMGRLWLGSVADFVVRHAAVPVILVRSEQPEGRAATTPIHGILVPLDLSAESQGILEPVIALAHAAQAHVTLLYVLEEYFQAFEPGVLYPTPEDPVIAEVRRNDAQHELDQIADRLRERGLAVSARVVTDMSAASGILRTLEEQCFGLVAMTTQGASGIRRFVLGSVADKVIRGAGKAVLVVRPAAKSKGLPRRFQRS